MTTPIKTQCPHCQAIFNLPKAQLNKMDSKARCGYCEQFFLLNEHIITPENEQANAKGLTPSADIAHNPIATQKPPTVQKPADADIEPAAPAKSSVTTIKPVVKPPQPKKPLGNKPVPEKKSPKIPIEDIDDDMLIHDDMEIEDTQESALDYEALEDMDAWISQLDHTEIVNPAIEPLASPSPLDNNKAPISENAWLESLLAEEKGESTPYSDAPKDDSSLAKLLTDIGIPAQDSAKKAQATATKKQQHTPSAATRTRPLIATLLWTLGSLVLILLLFVQYIFFNINTLIKNPEYKAQLQTICEMTGCRLPSADIDAFTITDISHSASKVNDSATFSDIKAVLVNQSPESQLLPNIKVSIYKEETLIGEFIAMPADYLLSTQAQLAAEYDKPVMFTLPLPAKQISNVVMETLY